MARAMPGAEWRTFLSEGTRAAKPATTRADGRPHVAAVWVLDAEASIVPTTAAGTVKDKALRRDARVCL